MVVTEMTAAALAALREAIGAEWVLTAPEAVAPYARAVCGLTRRIPAVLRPGGTEDVLRLVAAANRFQLPLYPVSCGRNWGMGSRLPPRDDTLVVDLSRMNRIREISVAGHYAVVEPGVTQRQLADELRARDLPLLLNVTGSGADTSLLGNALDRGVGYFAARADGLSGLEVVLGSGRLLRTGFGHYENARTTHLFRHGMGPSLDGLFAQSNFGIVTAAGFDLIPRPAAQCAAILKIAREEDLAPFIDRLAALRRDGSVQTVFHIGNRARSEITLAPLLREQLARRGYGARAADRAWALDQLRQAGFGPWSAVGGLMGPPDQLRASVRALRRAMRGVARVTILDDARIAFARAALRRLGFSDYLRRQAALLEAVWPLYELTKGIPTDAPLHSVYWPVGDAEPDDWREPDRGPAGLLYCLPILPAEGGTAAAAMQWAEEIFGRRGFTPYSTLNLMDDRSFECVITLAFDRERPERQSAAHEAIRELEDRYAAEGFPVYRTGLASLPRLVRADDPFWQTAREVKKALDPNGIIAPGRYSLD